MGLNGLTDFCAKMGFIQPVTQKRFQKITRSLSATSTEVTKDLMNAAALRLRTMKNPKSPEAVTDIAVSIDGTWQCRGYTSKIGIVFIITIDTGEVLDYEIKCLYCQQCSTQKCKLSSEAFNDWYENHKLHCTAIMKALHLQLRPLRP